MVQEFKLDNAKTELEQLRAKRRNLTKARSGLEAVTSKSDVRSGTTRSGTKLDQSLEDYKGYKTTIADLSAGLTDTLNEYVTFASKRQSFEGVEKFVRVFTVFGGEKWAHRHRVARIGQQGPKQNLRLVLEYAAELVGELREVQEDAIVTMGDLQMTIDDVVGKISEYEPVEERLHEKLNLMEAAYKELEERNKNATPAEQAKYAVEMNEKHKELVKQRGEYDEVLTVYNQAKQALEPNRQAFKGFEQMVRDLGIQAVQINEKMINIQKIYEAAPEAIEIMMKTKGMEELDAGMNVATEKSLEMIGGAAIGVTDSTLRRQEAELVTADFMRNIMGKMYDMSKDFTEREEAVRVAAHRSNEERYGTN